MITIVNLNKSSLVVKPEMDRSTIPLAQLEAMEITCHATEENKKMFMKVIDPRCVGGLTRRT
jgi:hypothetical protein